MEKKFKILKVTIEENYLIPMHDDERTTINGWSLDTVIEDWFTRYGSLLYHATRDSYKIEGSRKFIKSEVIETVDDS